ncbi:hypothetical protein PUN28_000030 [Cardiocondyla obscurior]|uniref:Uncharacterized protein n=1 Tax=Cardiocondyla obscurior TaxID=286306 RepID=A0AAW2GXT8_9HYME
MVHNDGQRLRGGRECETLYLFKTLYGTRLFFSKPMIGLPFIIMSRRDLFCHTCVQVNLSPARAHPSFAGLLNVRNHFYLLISNCIYRREKEKDKETIDTVINTIITVPITFNYYASGHYHHHHRSLSIIYTNRVFIFIDTFIRMIASSCAREKYLDVRTNTEAKERAQKEKRGREMMTMYVYLCIYDQNSPVRNVFAQGSRPGSH